MNPKMQKKMSNFAIVYPVAFDWPFSIFFKSLMSKKAIGIKKNLNFKQCNH